MTSSAIDTRVAGASAGPAWRVSDTGTTASDTTRAATTMAVDPVTPVGDRSSWPTMRPPSTTTMYSASTRPRAAGSVCPFSQLSATTNSPARHIPVTSRKASQGTGCTHRAWASMAAAANDDRAANTRMWPTVASRRGTRVDPIR